MDPSLGRLDYASLSTGIDGDGTLDFAYLPVELMVIRLENNTFTEPIDLENLPLNMEELGVPIINSI